MNVNVGAFDNGLDCLAHRPSIFDDRFVLGHIAHRDLVAERNVVDQGDASGSFAFKGDRANFASFFQIFDGDSNVIVDFVY